MNETQNPKAGTKEFEDQYPSQEAINSDLEYNRVLARSNRELFVDARKLTIELAASLSKWILTSLLAVNSGGAIAVAQLPLRPGLQILSGTCFVIGLILPLLIALISIRNGDTYAPPLGRAIDYWQHVELRGQRDRATELSTFELATLTQRGKRWPNRLGIASTALFITGCMIASYGLWTGLTQLPPTS